jgi:hypothetical protein
MITGTSAGRIKERMERIMNDISNAANAKSAGSIPRLRPYEIATLLIAPGGGRTVRVMDATDDEFQMFVLDAGLPVEEDGIAEWSFDDRCGIINHALKHGIKLPFIENKNNSDSEQKTIPEKRPKVAQEAR